MLKSNHYSMMDGLQSCIFIADHRDPWRATLSWIIFFLQTFAVPVCCNFLFQRCSACRPFDWIVQVSLSVLSMLSFVTLLLFTRNHGFHRFLFVGAGNGVGRRYSEEFHRSTMLLCAFVLPCFLVDGVYNTWSFTSRGSRIPYLYNIYLSHTMACILHMTSWLYRTLLFLLVCVLFRLTCSLQTLRLQDFSQVFDKLSDVGPILVEHLTIKRNLRIISHRFRAFILLTLILVTASQFASLLVTIENGSIVDFSTTGELAVIPLSLFLYLYPSSLIRIRVSPTGSPFFSKNTEGNLGILKKKLHSTSIIFPF